MANSERRITTEPESSPPIQVLVGQNEGKISLCIDDGLGGFGTSLTKEQVILLCMHLMHAVEEAASGTAPTRRSDDGARGEHRGV